jgi:hypothetical protein
VTENQETFKWFQSQQKQTLIFNLAGSKICNQRVLSKMQGDRLELLGKFYKLFCPKHAYLLVT